MHAECDLYYSQLPTPSDTKPDHALEADNGSTFSNVFKEAINRSSCHLGATTCSPIIEPAATSAESACQRKLQGGAIR